MKILFQFIFSVGILTSNGSVMAAEFSLKDVETHSTLKDCWIIINNKVYDISQYIPKHPSKPDIFLKYCGKNADIGWETKDKNRKHSPNAKKLLDTYEVGSLLLTK